MKSRINTAGMRDRKVKVRCIREWFERFAKSPPNSRTLLRSSNEQHHFRAHFELIVIPLTMYFKNNQVAKRVCLIVSVHKNERENVVLTIWKYKCIYNLYLYDFVFI